MAVSIDFMLVFVVWFSHNEENIIFNVDVHESSAFLFKMGQSSCKV